MAFAKPLSYSFGHNNTVLLKLKSFLIWSFTLLVCYLIVGFPVFFLTLLVGSLLATTLQPILPTSAVLVVAGSLTLIHLLVFCGGAAVLTYLGIHPQEVSWLNWSNSPDLKYPIAYPSCPLTCPLRVEEAVA
jgi:hypothetical protein